jgi:PAS domain S-box-containing protein
MDSPPTIIIVEDDKGLNHLIQKILRKNGFQTQGAFNGTEAIRQVAGSENVMLLLDYELKDMTGKEVIEALEEKKCIVPFIIVTGQGNEKIAVEMMKMGAVDYLVKGEGFIDILPHVIGKTVNELAYKIKILEAEKELHESEERFRATFEHAAVGIDHLMPGGEFLRVNQRFCDILGYSREELMGLNANDITHPEYRDSSQRQIELLVEGKIQSFTIEKIYIRKDSSEVWGKITMSLVRDAEGSPKYFIGVLEDITKRKKAEEALLRSEERFRRMTGAITDYTYTVCVEDEKALETSHSEACIAVTGYSSREFAHDPYLWIKMVFEEDRDIVRHQAEQVLEGQFPHSIEHRIVRKDGAMRWVESTVVPNDSGGGLSSYDGMIRDITERKRLEEALLEIEEREQRRIGQDLHDDLGQLLTGIAFKSQVLQRKLEKKLTVSPDNIAEITDLVNQAKDQARLLSRGLLSLETEEESLMYALKDLTLNTERIYGISCRFICNSIVPIYSKPAVTHLYRISQEAVTNAVKHGRPSHIDISLSRSNDKVELTIKDDGAGNPKILNGSSGMGLQIMQYRSNMIGALLDVRSDTDSGTEIKCSFSDKVKGQNK